MAPQMGYSSQTAPLVVGRLAPSHALPEGTGSQRKVLLSHEPGWSLGGILSHGPLWQLLGQKMVGMCCCTRNK